jgi:hypothetical protein
VASSDKPIANTSLPPSSNVIRHISPQFIDGDTIDGSGFLRRPAEVAPSVNWLEWFDPPIELQIDGVRKCSNRTFKKSHLLVQLNADQTKAHVKAAHPDNLALEFIHDPLEQTNDNKEDHSHSLILGVPVKETPEAELVKDLLAQCICARFPAIK